MSTTTTQTSTEIPSEVSTSSEGKYVGTLRLSGAEQSMKPSEPSELSKVPATDATTDQTDTNTTLTTPKQTRFSESDTASTTCEKKINFKTPYSYSIGGASQSKDSLLTPATSSAIVNWIRSWFVPSALARPGVTGLNVPRGYFAGDSEPTEQSTIPFRVTTIKLLPSPVSRGILTGRPIASSVYTLSPDTNAEWRTAFDPSRARSAAPGENSSNASLAPTQTNTSVEQ